MKIKMHSNKDNCTSRQGEEEKEKKDKKGASETYQYIYKVSNYVPLSGSCSPHGKQIVLPQHIAEKKLFHPIQRERKDEKKKVIKSSGKYKYLSYHPLDKETKEKKKRKKKSDAN